MKLFKYKQQITNDDPIPYDIPATYGAEYDEYDYLYTKLPSDSVKWEWYESKCESCGKYHKSNLRSSHCFYTLDGYDSMDYTECWRCILKDKVYSIKSKIKHKIKRRKDQHNMFWKLYWNTPKKERKEFIRWHFWGWMMDRLPKLYKWCDKHLKCNTLPF